MAEPYLGFEIDEKALEAGTWLDASSVMEGFEICLRSTESQAFENAQIKHVLAIPSELDEEKNRLAMRDARAKAIAEACIVDWRGLSDKKTGQEVPRSEELAYAFVTNKRYLPLTKFIDAKLTEVSDTLPKLTEERVGNSDARS